MNGNQRKIIMLFTRKEPIVYLRHFGRRRGHLTPLPGGNERTSLPAHNRQVSLVNVAKTQKSKQPD